MIRRSVVAALLALTLPSLATAQSAATRRGIIERAAAARDRGDHARALVLAQEAAALGATPSLRAFIAHEHAALGDHREAADEAARCVREATADPALAGRDALLAECRTLESAHRRLADAPRPAPPPAPPPALAVATPRRDDPDGASAGPGPWIVGGFGGASLALSLVFVALRAGALDARDALCGGRNPCDLSTPAQVATAQAAQGDAIGYSTATNVALGVAGASLVAATIWWAVGRAPRARRVAPTLSYDPGAGFGASLRGQF